MAKVKFARGFCNWTLSVQLFGLSALVSKIPARNSGYLNSLLFMSSSFEHDVVSINIVVCGVSKSILVRL